MGHVDALRSFHLRLSSDMALLIPVLGLLLPLVPTFTAVELVGVAAVAACACVPISSTSRASAALLIAGRADAASRCFARPSPRG